jgi:hypothetical protein
LPEFLSGGLEKIHKLVRGNAEIADTVAARQGAYVEKDTAATRKDHFNNVMLQTLGVQEKAARMVTLQVEGVRRLGGAIPSIARCGTMNIGPD